METSIQRKIKTINQTRRSYMNDQSINYFVIA